MNGIAEITGKYGTFYFKADGSYTYTLDESKTALQALAEGQTDNEHPVYYTVNNTTELTSNLIVRVKGTNDAATITGTDTGSVDEDTASTATGILLADDVDNTDNVFQASSGAAAYGSFSIDADGNWTYTLDDTNTTVDALNDGDSLPDSFVVKSADGTEHTVTVNITGTTDVLPPTGGGGSGGGGTSLKPYIVDGFDANDVLRYSAGQVNYEGFTLIGDYGDSGIQDTKVTFGWEKGEKFHTGDAILVDFVGFVPETHLIAVNH